MRKKWITALMLGTILAATGSVAAFADTGTTEDASASAWQETAQKELASMKQIAQNDYLELYLDEEETDIAVVDKTSGQIWFSNPVDVDQDEVSNRLYQSRLKSQIGLTYMNENTQVSVMDNYSNSISDGQFEIEPADQGVKITYRIGDSAAFIILPERISMERMDQFVGKMDDSQSRRVVRNYNEEDGYYVLRSGVKDYLREELAGYFADAGYTEEDYAMDSGESDEGEDAHEWFQIPITYQLDGPNLVVTVDPEQIAYNDEGFYLVSLDILRYFGASLQEDGDLFVPDGSGALIHFNNGKIAENSYSAAVYGQDRTFLYTSWDESQIDAASTVKMPVFGIRDGGKAMLAVLEDGDAYATVNAEIAGKTTGYNYAYAAFTYLQYGETSLDDMVGANSYYMYSPAEFEGTYRLRYFFLSGEDADYSGMAKSYRKYLKEKGVLKEKTDVDALPFYAEYIGAIDRPETFLGIKYNAVQPMTTFAQAEEITSRLEDQGISNLNVVYSGWMNGGLHSTANTRLKVVSRLEDKMTLEEFEKNMREAGNDLYMTLDLQYVYKDKLLDGYSGMRYAPRYFDNTNIKVNQYGLASRVNEGTLASLISPVYAETIAGKMSDAFTKKNLPGVNLGTLSWELYSDLSRSSYTDRQMAKAHNTAAMALLEKDDKVLLGDNANAYVWGCADEIFNVPMDSNNYRIIDEEIPFYEMVIHGCLEYAGEAVNMSDDYETMFLKSAECGAGLNFKWISESNSILKDTEFDGLYSVSCETWFDRAVESYRRLNDDLGELVSVEIRSHEKLAEDVVKVVYENGTCVYVNYSEEDAAVDGVTVPSRDYLVVKEAA